jgi:hypothetical protein
MRGREIASLAWHGFSEVVSGMSMYPDAATVPAPAHMSKDPHEAFRNDIRELTAAQGSAADFAARLEKRVTAKQAAEVKELVLHYRCYGAGQVIAVLFVLAVLGGVVAAFSAGMDLAAHVMVVVLMATVAASLWSAVRRRRV